MTDVPLDYLAGGIVVNKDTFMKIPSSFQGIIMESFKTSLDQLKIVTRNENREAIKVMRKQGVKIVGPTKDQVEEFKRLSNKAMGHIYGQSFSKKTFEEVTSLLESYRMGGK
jgi:TRAP-type C4-dicarboxylate transport system substrate-binding protein